MPDVFASTANHLVRDGWQRGLTWGFEVKLPQGFPYQEAELDIEKPVSHWQQVGVRTIDGQPLPALPGGTSILVLAGYKGPAFLVTKNYKTILKYNYSTSYALSVAYLGQRVMGGPGVQGEVAGRRAALALEEREEIQQRLIDRGYLAAAPTASLASRPERRSAPSNPGGAAGRWIRDQGVSGRIAPPHG